MFHISQLKKKIVSQVAVQSQPPATGSDGQVLEEPVAVLGKIMVKKNNAAEVQILV